MAKQQATNGKINKYKRIKNYHSPQKKSRYHIAIDARVDKIDAFGFDCDSNCRNCDIQMSGPKGYDVCVHSAKQSGIILNDEEPCLGYAGRGHGYVNE